MMEYSMEKKLTGSKSKICSPQGNEHTISFAEFLQRFGADINGFSEQEAARRLKEFGLNVLEETGKESLLIAYLRQFWNFFSILLIIGVLLFFLAEYLDPGKGNLHIGIAIGLVVILNSIFTFIQEYQAAKTIESFRQLLPPNAKVLRDGKIRDILASEIVAGDVILIEEGDKIPADRRLIETNALKVDNSSITGESEPQLRSLECTHPKICIAFTPFAIFLLGIDELRKYLLRRNVSWA
jgi:sodium/potassium-transporting ATPase subunit alpha